MEYYNEMTKMIGQKKKQRNFQEATASTDFVVLTNYLTSFNRDRNQEVPVWRQVPLGVCFFFKFINVFFSFFFFVFLTFGQAKSRPNDRPIPYTNIECGK